MLILGIIILIVGLIVELIDRIQNHGHNNLTNTNANPQISERDQDRKGINATEALMKIDEAVNNEEHTKWGYAFKSIITRLGASAFDRFKRRGVRKVDKHELVASRGFDKLLEIVSATKVRPKGKVLSLCCGRGGWEQLYAADSEVSHITAVTLGKGPGHEGHEDFTDKWFPGKEKVNLVTSDARDIPLVSHDTLLFDGGESHPDYSVEAKKFNQLFSTAVMRQISQATKHFILKVLTPTHPETIGMLKKIQALTNKGSFYRPTVCRNSTMEMYFVSTKPMDVDNSVKLIVKEFIRRGIENRQLQARKKGPLYTYTREEIRPKPIPLLTPLNMEVSIAELGPPIPEPGRDYNHWESMGVYPIGVAGTSGMRYNKYGLACATRLLSSLPGFDNWKLTDTTPEGFIKVFNQKIDKAPVENHKYEQELMIIYEALAEHFVRRGFKLREMSWEELEIQANKQGAPGHLDIKEGIYSVADFLKLPDWRKRVEACRTALKSGYPIQGIFNSMGKREKKMSSGPAKGSRMIAYLGIAMRLLEMKLFGNLMKLTKPELNRFGVGGLGIHDLGQRIKEIWKGSGFSDDIAAFDTRMSLYMLSLESWFVGKVGGTDDHTNMYRLYGFPHILVPVPSPFRRSQLLAGQGQRMSGSQPTYPMNTITRLVLFLLQLGVALGVTKDKLRQFVLDVMNGGAVVEVEGKKVQVIVSGCVSGDDANFSSDKWTELIASFGHVLDEVGFPRKDLTPKQSSPVAYDIMDIEFCSHRYEPISFYDSQSDVTVVKYMPTRDVSQIVAKSLLRVGGSDEKDLDSLGWISAQGNNLCVNYAHLRTCRALGFAYKAVAPPNVILTNKGGFLRPKPWLRTGDLLDIYNEVHFGVSTKYPVDGFKVRSWSHVGYMKPKREVAYDPECFIKKRSQWRQALYHDVVETIHREGTGGDVTYLENWRIKRLD